VRLRSSLRTRFLVLVVAGAVLPLALIGLWLTRTASRSGEALLTQRLDALLESSAQEIRTNWPRVRSDLLTVAESEAARAMLAVRGGSPGIRPPEAAGRIETGSTASVMTDSALEVPAALVAATRSLTLLDKSGSAVWTAEQEPALRSARPGLLVRLPVFRQGSSESIGSIEAEIILDALLGERVRRTSPLGSVLAATDPATGASLLPLPFDGGLLSDDRFAWGGDDWIVRRGGLADPVVQLTAAAPITPLVAPFDRAARQGLFILLAVAMLSIGIAVLLTGMMTRSLGSLASAADAVARGELEHALESPGDDEIGRVAAAFNLMTANLRRTLRQLADRQALAAVGEFAASLSHEIRNALTSIRLDVQVAGEHLPPDPAVREPHERALGEIGRLEETVTGALRLARSGKAEKKILDLHGPLEAAAHAATPEFARRGAELVTHFAPEPISVAGDPASLEQLFLNLLLNAAQALDAGKRTFVDMNPGSGEEGSEPGSVTVSIRDEGPGIPVESRDRVFEPFYSTRAEGTGLGLPIARRIVQAHGGRMDIESEPGRGCTVAVTLPLARTRSPTRASSGSHDSPDGSKQRMEAT
jgi:signal transduction histidine kinase